jgi:hypothetical protein
MMGWNDGRNRSVRKAVTFTPGEWERVERRLERAGGVYPLGWNAYARTMLLKGRYVAIEVPFDVPRVTVQVNRIGINVNQIARKCNEDELVTVEELRQVRRELEKCYRLLGDAWKLMHDAKFIARDGGGRVYPPIPSDDAVDTPSPEA